MGRPPIGKVAMTGAERVRKYRARHAVTKPVTKHSAGDDTARVRQLEADIRLLKADLSRERERRKAAEAKASTTTAEAVLRDIKRIAKTHGGTMRVDEYNKIIKVIHPDRKPSDAEKNEAFRLFTERMKPSVDAKKRAAKKAART
jgi:hypothetical protein